ncbi:pathogenesis-related protein 1-like [Dioscorea cayenensis subsp. rotundata]|uniref:Pathogenesis-related protein 1-like n=1 Tax=Dioscorea cayennensis subsp. rotundata TaxID=55577 RepID=A0AB40BW84_DIOCR|nr:pathogenesis-related protein 1-like [Dioscorea cayenensis subsp. rotundata]
MAISKLAIYLACIIALTMAGHAVAHNSPDHYLNPHNSARSDVGVGPVTWNDTVAAYAEDYANQRAKDCELIHSNGSYGENLFWGSGTNHSEEDAVNAWVSEKQDYDYYSNTCAKGKVCEHYTQVVWSSSTNIGCARVVCNNDGGVFIICNYFLAGNIEGQRPY